ncbi:MAG: glycosyltransferase family 1 protein [Parcubacteria group bacterium]
MRIAIQAADLDHARIDGTRVYILNCLKYFGKLDPASEFLIYHRGKFNPELTPPNFPNYKIKKLSAPAFWTQTRFAYEIWKDKPDVLWMPMHNLPAVHRRKMKTFVTIHDLAFKFFPESFTKKDLAKLNFLTDRAVRHTDRLIAISQATKNDILKIYPEVSAENIRVISHGFDPEVYAQPRDLTKEKEIKEKLGIRDDYLLYIGAIQPRKNLEVLIEAFNLVKKKRQGNLSLVLVGEKAWLSENTLKKAKESPFSMDIIMPGRLKFCDLGHLCRGAGMFVFPSLYEGFGIPPLEAMAAKVPVILANNSSLPEVGGDAALYFDAKNSQDLADKIASVLEDENLRAAMIAKGLEQAKKFSWEKCARETLNYLKS